MKKTFLIHHKEYLGDDTRAIQAWDAESAAEAYADYFDSDGDYSLMSGSTIEIEVEDSESGKLESFICSGESVPLYSARLKKAEQ